MPKNHPKLIAPHAMAISIMTKKEDFDAASQYADVAMQISKLAWNDMHSDSSSLYSNIGMMYSAMGDYDAAISNYERAIDIQKQILLADTDDMAYLYDCLGALYIKLGDFDNAYLNYVKSGEIYVKLRNWTEDQFESYKEYLITYIEERLGK